MDSDDLHATLIAKLKESRKYRHLSDDVLSRISRWAIPRHNKHKQVLAAAKRKLHQIYGAYATELHVVRLEKLLDDLAREPEPEAVRSFCLKTLGRHRSTAERIPILEEFHDRIFEETGRPEIILDLACGLNPFALPWMPIDNDTRYVAWDIDHRVIRLINKFLTIIGRPPAAECRDIFASMSEIKADMIFLLKTLPCLERQETGISSRLLTDLPCKYMIASFPVKSLGGRDKGMRRNYENKMIELVRSLDLSMTTLNFQTELVFVIRK